MLTDGIQLLGSSTAQNFSIDSGATLPASGNNIGELFYRTDFGLHVYTSAGWTLIGAGSWGTISGTLSNQTDLVSALGAKADLVTGHVPLTQLASGTAAAGKYLDGTGAWTTLPSGGSGTVTTLSVTTANGVSGSVANATTTPAITLALGAITPSSVAATGAISAASFTGPLTGAVTGTSSLATAVVGGATGSLIYQSASNTTGFIAAGTSGYVLTSTGTSSAPTWQASSGGGGSSTIPQNSQSADYTLVLGDGGGHILHPAADTTARTFTIPANSAVAYPIGTALTFINQNGAGGISIAISTDTMRLAGTGTAGTRALAPNGLATAIKITTTEWIISGTGLT